MTQHTFISDRKKKIAKAVKEKYPQAIYLYCCQYIVNNLQQRYSNKIKPLFWKAYKAKAPQLYKNKMAKLKKVSTDVFDYLCNIDNKL